MSDVYLGDGLYAAFDDGWHIELYAHNGIEKTNAIFLNPTVCSAFLEYMTGLRSSSKSQSGGV